MHPSTLTINRVYFGLVPNGTLSPSGLIPFILHIFVTTCYNAALTIRSLLWSSVQTRQTCVSRAHSLVIFSIKNKNDKQDPLQFCGLNGQVHMAATLSPQDHKCTWSVPFGTRPLKNLHAQLCARWCRTWKMKYTRAFNEQALQSVLYWLWPQLDMFGVCALPSETSVQISHW